MIGTEELKYVPNFGISHYFPQPHSARFLLMYSPLKSKLFGGRYHEVHAPSMSQLQRERDGCPHPKG